MNQLAFPDGNLLTEHFLNTLSTEIEPILSQFWEPPESLQAQIALKLKTVLPLCNVLVSGETTNLTLYIFGRDKVLIYTPFDDVADNVALRDTKLTECAHVIHGHLAVIPLCESLYTRLQMPKVLLINLSVIDNFPIPRLSLSTSMLAAFLRRQQRALVKIIDMQMGQGESWVVDEALAFEPAIVGLSISYGQKFLAFDLLRALHQAFSQNTAPLFVAGNVIPAFAPQEFFANFPKLLIAAGEGEETLLGLVKHISEGIPLEEVQGLIRLTNEKQIEQTNLHPLSISNLCFPALDTIDDLATKKGALTLELSRGCQYNVCTFCPRKHKASKWKGLSSKEALRQLKLMANVMDRKGLSRRVYLADEEFIGYLPDEGDTKRIAEIAQGIIDFDLHIKLDTECRINQVYDPSLPTDWHLRRMLMWKLLKQAGLDRLFIGVESAAPDQLKRYGKGSSPEQTIIGVRILTALGIRMRFGFIMFDPLMIGLQDLKLNLAFLERRDVLLDNTQLSKIRVEDLFAGLLTDTEFVKAHSLGQPLYSVVSYMLASLEVLINSPYERMMMNTEKTTGAKLILDGQFPDTNMGRRRAKYLDPVIGTLSDSSQRWIDRNFALAYALKSFYKVAADSERRIWLASMEEYREISHFLLKTMIYAIDDHVDKEIEESLYRFHGTEFSEVQSIRKLHSASLVAEATLALFEHRMRFIVDRISTDLATGVLKDNSDSRMQLVIDAWYAHMGQWDLINDPMLS